MNKNNKQFAKDTRFDLYLQKHLKAAEFKRMYYEEGLQLAVAYEINKLRKSAKLSQQSLAQKMGTTQSVVARLERGGQNFTLATLGKLARVFDKKLEVVFR